MDFKKIRALLLLLGMTFFGALGTAFAFSDCYRSCMDQSGCWSPDPGTSASYCSGVQARCSSECRDAAEAPRPKRDTYGAIAYSKDNGAYGYSHGWKDKGKAQKVALDNCRQNGKGCKSVVWFKNSCGAVASDGKHVTWGRSTVRRLAKQEAFEKCQKSLFSGKCENIVSSCSE
jgi:hypothetical protein